MAFLQIRGLTKHYGPVVALQDFDLDVARGELISLLGPSGCGKTTTLQALAGFVPVTAGSVRLDGRDLTHVPPERRGLGIVFQSYALFPHMTVADNVGFGLEMRKVGSAERSRRIARMLEMVQMLPLAARYPRELSGGQRQRVALARALVIEPHVLLLDEPLSNLDAKLREAMQFELRRIQRKLDTTTLMVTHDQGEALSISDRVVVMDGGHTRQIDTPQRLYEHPHSRFISGFVGKTNVLPGVLDGDVLRLPGGLRMPLPAAVPGAAVRPDGLGSGPIDVVLRPEKLRLKPAGQGRLAATVQDRFFLGSQWLYRVECSLGGLDVVEMNDSSAPFAEGDAVALDWPDDAVRLLPQGAPA